MIVHTIDKVDQFFKNLFFFLKKKIKNFSSKILEGKIEIGTKVVHSQPLICPYFTHLHAKYKKRDIHRLFSGKLIAFISV